MTINMHAPKNRSSHIGEIGYDDETNTLAVTFRSGDTYHYPGVGRGIFDALNSAESAGSFFHKSIRGKFNPTRR